jgi:hypothetical protein
MEVEGSLTRSKEPDTVPYPEAGELTNILQFWLRLLLPYALMQTAVLI